MIRANEWLGRVGGLALAPVTGAIAAVRRSRMFHPVGLTFTAEVACAGSDLRHRAVADRFVGHALVRLSSAWWKGHEWIDALGVAVRFRKSDEVTVEPAPDDQDLLFATIRTPWTTPVAPLKTHVHDFLANDYYAVSPFFVPELGRAKWRLVSSRPGMHAASRADRLRLAVETGNAVFELQERGLLWTRRWAPVAQLRLVREVELDQGALRFSPFRAGRGVEPRGFVHALRRATYLTSQAARPNHEPASVH